MDAIITYIEKLAQISPYIKLYRDFNSYVILRNIGKITGEVDKQYVEFLLKTNGASILDYCFLGLKNHTLGVNVYDNMRELWQSDCLLTFRLWLYDRLCLQWWSIGRAACRSKWLAYYFKKCIFFAWGTVFSTLCCVACAPSE